MQRTTKGTEFAFVKASLINGEVKTTQGVARYPITDPKIING